DTLTKMIGFVAVTLASINIFGGFMVTQRMLAMFKKKER
ncbi:MAG: proton-translocating transhydrogenase family protein, partial [Gammaproteobacteria bacterium]